MAIKHHQWWRLVTPLFVHPEGWRQIAFNFSSILVLGLLMEPVLGRWRWLVLYFASGFTGEIAGYLWQPVGGGASVAGAGLLGAVAFWLILENRSTQAAIGGAAILLGGTILIIIRDIHGPPIIVGAFLAWALLKTKRTKEHLQRQSGSPNDEHRRTATFS